MGYTDGTYAIKGIYGSEDDLEFTIDSESVVENIPEIVLTNYYAESAPYYYFHAGKYDICVYYQKGSGYTGWEGEAEEPSVWFYTYVYEGETCVGSGMTSSHGKRLPGAHLPATIRKPWISRSMPPSSPTPTAATP